MELKLLKNCILIFANSKRIKFKTVRKKNSLTQAIKKARRDVAISQGAYDGRFAPKVVKNKKKEASKKACRRLDYRQKTEDN